MCVCLSIYGAENVFQDLVTKLLQDFVPSLQITRFTRFSPNKNGIHLLQKMHRKIGYSEENVHHYASLFSGECRTT